MIPRPGSDELSIGEQHVGIFVYDLVDDELRRRAYFPRIPGNHLSRMRNSEKEHRTRTRTFNVVCNERSGRSIDDEGTESLENCMSTPWDMQLFFVWAISRIVEKVTARIT